MSSISSNNRWRFERNDQELLEDALRRAFPLVRPCPEKFDALLDRLRDPVPCDKDEPK